MSGQWRFGGMGGRYALDYTAVFMRMERMRLDDDAWELMFSDLRAVERAVLNVIAARGTT